MTNLPVDVGVTHAHRLVRISYHSAIPVQQQYEYGGRHACPKGRGTMGTISAVVLVIAIHGRYYRYTKRCVRVLLYRYHIIDSQ